MVHVILQHHPLVIEEDVIGLVERPAVTESLVQVFLIQPGGVLFAGFFPEGRLLAGHQQIAQFYALLFGQIPVKVLHAGQAVGAAGVFIGFHGQGHQVAASALFFHRGIELPALLRGHGHVGRILQKRIGQPFDGAIVGRVAFILNQHGGQLLGDGVVQLRLVLKGKPLQVHFRAAVSVTLLIGFIQGMDDSHQRFRGGTGLCSVALVGDGRFVSGLCRRVRVVAACQQRGGEQEQKCHTHGIPFLESMRTNGGI